jgi:hypothetical protein
MYLIVILVETTSIKLYSTIIPKVKWFPVNYILVESSAIFAVNLISSMARFG